MNGYCPVCFRENAPLKQYRKYDGSLAFACADEQACKEAFGKHMGIRPTRFANQSALLSPRDQATIAEVRTKPEPA